MEYSRNLGTGDGIELVKLFQIPPVSLIALPDPDKFTIYPNPCNSVARISFDLPGSSDVTVEVYTSAGAKVYSRVVNGLTSGEHELRLDLEGWNKGVYFCVLHTRMNSGPLVTTKKLIID